jgi:segregation and condensation protein B
MERRALLEAIVYVAEEPVSPEQIAEALGMPADVVQGDLDQLVEETASDTRGIEVRKVAGGYKMFTKAAHHEAIRGFVKTLRPKLRLSLPALETLAVVAYKQPVTVPEIQAIRGVNAGGVIHTLLNHKLITTAGRKKVIGRPMQYKTTKEFLVQFGLNDLSELPNLKELEELSRAALGEGEEPEESTARASGTGSENDGGVAAGDEESAEEASFEQGADDAADDEERESASSPIAALSAAVGGAGVAPSRADEESEEDPES